MLILEKYFSIKILCINENNFEETFFRVVVVSFVFFLWLLRALFILKKIVIDKAKKIITISHVFSNKKRVYNINDIDGFKEYTHGGIYRVSYTIIFQNGEKKEILSERTISNYKEISQYLLKQKGLGSFHYPFLELLKDMFLLK
jgi:hypothetical protein